MKRLGSLFCLLVVAAGLTVPSTAGATILLQRGIGGVTLGMTQAQVQARAGKPLAVRRGRTSAGRWTAYAYRNFTVVFQGGPRATNISTSSPRERTPRGVGVGSTERMVKNRIGGVRCRTLFGSRACTVGRALPGQRITTFSLKNGRVVRVTILQVLRIS